MSDINIFTNIYENKIWGDDEDPSYSGSSGSGSSIEESLNRYFPFLYNFIISNNIESVVDLGCGSCKSGEYIYSEIPSCHYTGYDAYHKIIEANKLKYSNQQFEFIHKDFYAEKESLQPADLCILKDVLQHWSLEKIYTFMDYVTQSKKYKYILLINCSSQSQDDTDIITGGGRPLSCDYLPLKKYSPEKLLCYNTKEISLITC